MKSILFALVFLFASSVQVQGQSLEDWDLDGIFHDTCYVLKLLEEDGQLPPNYNDENCSEEDWDPYVERLAPAPFDEIPDLPDVPTR